MESSKLPNIENFLKFMQLARNEETGRYYFIEFAKEPPNNRDCYFDFSVQGFVLVADARASKFERCVKLHFDPVTELESFLAEVKKSVAKVLNEINRAVAGIITGRNRVIEAKPGPTSKLSNSQFEYIKLRLVALFQDALVRLENKREGCLKSVEHIETIGKSLWKIVHTKERFDVQMGLYHTLFSLHVGGEVSPHEETLAGAGDWNTDQVAVQLSELFRMKSVDLRGVTELDVRLSN